MCSHWHNAGILENFRKKYWLRNLQINTEECTNVRHPCYLNFRRRYEILCVNTPLRRTAGRHGDGAQNRKDWASERLATAGRCYMTGMSCVSRQASARHTPVCAWRTARRLDPLSRFMRVAQMQRRRICRYSRVSAERSFVVTTRSSDAAIQVKNTQLHSTHVLPGTTSRSIARRDFLDMLSINQLQIYIAPYVVSESEALSYTYIILSPFYIVLCILRRVDISENVWKPLFHHKW